MIELTSSSVPMGQLGACHHVPQERSFIRGSFTREVFHRGGLWEGMCSISHTGTLSRAHMRFIARP